jgi:hypothetical protein
MTTLRRLPWPPLVAATAVAWTVVVFAVMRPGEGLPVLAVSVAQLVLAAAAAYLVDDSAAPVTGVMPRPLWRRRAEVVTPGALMLAGAWAVVLVIVAGRAPRSTYVALSLEAATLALIALAAAALVARHGEDEPGAIVAPTVVLTGLALLLFQPMLHVRFFAEPGDELDPRLAAWVAFGALALLTLAGASRDSAVRPARSGHRLGAVHGRKW